MAAEGGAGGSGGGVVEGVGCCGKGAGGARRVRVAVARGHGEEEVVVDLEAELGGEGEEGEGGFGGVRFGVGARHVRGIGLDSIAWLGSGRCGLWRCELLCRSYMGWWIGYLRQAQTIKSRTP